MGAASPGEPQSPNPLWPKSKGLPGYHTQQPSNKGLPDSHLPSWWPLVLNPGLSLREQGGYQDTGVHQNPWDPH